MKVTSLQLPRFMAHWIAGNPFEPGVARVLDALEATGWPMVPGVPDAIRDDKKVIVLAVRPPNLPQGRSWASAVPHAMAAVHPVLDGLSAPSLNIVSLVHWKRSPAALADWLEAHGRKSDTYADRDMVDAMGVRLVPAKPGRWYKLVYCPDPIGLHVVNALLARKPGFTLEAAIFNRVFVISSEPWHPDALYPGLPIEDLA